MQVQCSDDPLKLKAQNVLGQFEDAKSLVNTPSALGVILMPLTPALVPKDLPLPASATNCVSSSGKLTACVKPQASGKTSEGEFLFVNKRPYSWLS